MTTLPKYQISADKKSKSDMVFCKITNRLVPDWQAIDSLYDSFQEAEKIANEYADEGAYITTVEVMD